MTCPHCGCETDPMKWIGLTGGIASGKTTAANLFRELRVPVIDADRLAHQALVRNHDKIVTYFGDGVLGDDGKIDRKALGLKVFNDEKRLKYLESLVHPYVQEQVAKKKGLFESAGEIMAVYDVPLLYENGLQDQFDQVIVVYVPEELSKERLMNRNGLTEQEALSRIGNQISIEKKKELADVVFDNQGDNDALKEQVVHYFNAIKG